MPLPLRRFVFPLVLLACIPATAQKTSPQEAAAVEVPSTVLHLLVQSELHRDAHQLSQALKAQLTSALMQVKQLELKTLPNANHNSNDRWKILEILRQSYGASIVVWVEESTFPQIFFYTPPKDGLKATISVRSLRPRGQDDSPISDETIAIAASSTVVSLLSNSKKARASKNLSVITQQQTTPKAPTPQATESQPKSNPFRPTIQGRYRGVRFASGILQHGGALALGIRPNRRLQLSLEFIQNAPIQLESDNLSMKISSRALGGAISGRIVGKPLLVDVGVQWTMENRRYDIHNIEAETELSVLPAKPHNIHSLGPNLLIGMRLGAMFFATVQSGVLFGIYEKRYKLTAPEGDITLLTPYTAKFYFAVGILLQL